MSLPNIHSIEQLIKILDFDPGYGGYGRIMEAIDFGPEAVEQYCTWRKERYTRNKVAGNEDYELLVICWEEGQRTQVHDYADQEAWIYVLSGELTEERFYEDKTTGELVLISYSKLGPGKFCYMNDIIGKHRFTNSSQGRAVTLSLYSEPLNAWNVYDERTRTTKSVPIHFDTDEGKPVDRKDQ